jgi:alpha-N-acetylglucosaminidase
VKTLAAALDTLLAASGELGQYDSYRYDVVNLTRQVLGQLGLPMVNAVEAAFTRKDGPALIAAEARAVGLLNDLDQLVGTREEFLLGRWLEDAKRWGRRRPSATSTSGTPETSSRSGVPSAPRVRTTT